MSTATILDPAELRAELLGRVDSVRDVLVDTLNDSQDEKRLVPEAVDAMKEADLFKMRAPREIGGWEAPPVVQMEILAALAEIDASAGWVAMVINNACAWMGAYLPDETLWELYGDGKFPLIAGVAEPSGKLEKVDGGFRVSDYRGRLCSGVHQAAWLRLTCFLDGDPTRPAMVIVPQPDVTILDTWNALGLRGSGSTHISLDDLFVPAKMVLEKPVRLRGGPQFRLQGLIASSYEHVGIALGIGRRALTEFAMAIDEKARTRNTAPREVVLNQLGRLTIALESATALATRTYEQDVIMLSDEDVDANTVGHDGPVIAAYATDIALQCAETMYKYAGAAAIYQPNTFERLVRDIHAATQHVMVQDTGYSALGARRLPIHDEVE